jgi:hypothetical protein
LKTSIKQTTSKTKEFFASLWQIILNQLKGRFIKLALKKLLGSGAALGFKGWLITFIATELFEELAVPFLNYLKRKGMLVYDRTQGRIKVKKLEKAKEENNEDRYDDIVDSI